MHIEKNSKVRTHSPLCTHSVQKVSTLLLIWNNNNLSCQKKNRHVAIENRKVHFINEVLLLQNPYKLMTSSACPLFYRQPPSMNCIPIFKRKSWAFSFYDFSKVSATPINKGFHTMAPQSNFALTSPVSTELS